MKKKVIRYYSYFWLFVYRQGSVAIHEWMNEWMKTRNDRNGDRVWKCTSVNDPCLQVYLQCGGLKCRKMEKKILGIHKCELLAMSLCELLAIIWCDT